MGVQLRCEGWVYGVCSGACCLEAKPAARIGAKISSNLFKGFQNSSGTLCVIPSAMCHDTRIFCIATSVETRFQSLGICVASQRLGWFRDAARERLRRLFSSCVSAPSLASTKESVLQLDCC